MKLNPLRKQSAVCKRTGGLKHLKCSREQDMLMWLSFPPLEAELGLKNITPGNQQIFENLK